MSVRSLRFAILLDGEPLEQWRVRCIERLLAAEGVELVALIVARAAWRLPTPPEPALGRLYARRLRRAQLRQAVELSDIAEDVPRVEVQLELGAGEGLALPDADVARVRALEPDVILSLGVDPPAGAVLEVPRHGVWTFDFDCHWTDRLGLAELWRVLGGEAVSEVALLRLTPEAGCVIVLRRGWLRNDHRAPLAGLGGIRSETAGWPASLCAALQRGERGSCEGQVVPAEPAGCPLPGAGQALRLAAAVVRNHLRTAWGRFFRHPQWNIGIVDQPIHALLNGNGQPPVRWFPLAGRRGFLADPFGVARPDGAAILCERFDYRRGKGMICCIDVADGEFTSEPRPALELPGHLSYPCVVEHQGALYCVPETLRTREVGLFKADRFPDRWSKVGTLVNDVAAIDPTVFRHGDRWWLICTDGDAGPDANLLVWHALELDGPWMPHPGNPVKCDVRSARPAGTPFEHGGELYRPAQDCSRGYGGRVVINRVTSLTPTTFAEEAVRSIAPPANGRYPAGRHTLSQLGDRTLIDGHRFVFVGVALLHFLRLWSVDIARGLARTERK